MKNVNFSTLWTSCFYSLERRFYVLEFRKRRSLGLYCLKKKLEKWQFLDQTNGLTPLEKCQFYNFLNFLFLYPKKTFFRSRISLKTFSCPLLPKKKVVKIAIFGLTPWQKVNFTTFWTSCLYSLKRRFYVLEFRKRRSAGLYCLKKKVWKIAIFGQKPWVNPFGKMSTFRLFELPVFIASKGGFSF